MEIQNELQASASNSDSIQDLMQRRAKSLYSQRIKIGGAEMLQQRRGLVLTAMMHERMSGDLRMRNSTQLKVVTE